MGYQTLFHFRAKLDFRLPAHVRHLLREQFKPWVEAVQDHHYGQLPVQASGKYQFPDYAAGYDPRWEHGNWGGEAQWPPHPFFSLPRASFIPWGGLAERPRSVYVEYPDGSSKLEFTCEFKNYDQEIQQFVNWISPYVRLRYGKRNRGRKACWVGYMQPETFAGRVDFYVHPTEQQLPGGSLVWGRSVIEDWNGCFW